MLWEGDGCPTTNPSTGRTEIQETASVVLFVQRGGCSFADKVASLISITSQVEAVVIIDLPESLELVAPGFGDRKDINLPVVMVRWSTAQNIFPGKLVLENREKHGGLNPGDDTSENPLLLGSVTLVSATLDELRGRRTCQCSVEAPEEMAEWHFMHREGCVQPQW